MANASRSSADKAELRWAGFVPELLPAYLEFAAREFGRHAYQANPTYPAWLYAENPCGGKAERDFLVATDDADQVVACVHKLRLPWNVPGEGATEIPALHNIMTTEAHRQGIGAMLLLSAVAREKHVLVAGVGAYLSAAYRKLGSQPVETAWYRWVLNPIAGAAHLALGRAGVPGPRWHTERLAWRGALRRLFPLLSVEEVLSDSRCLEIAQQLRADEGTASPAWSRDLIRWRFFHPIGPRHLAISRDGDRFFALVSLGRLRGARVARVVEVRAEDATAMRRGLRELRLLMLWLGGEFLLSFCAGERQNALLAEAGAPRIPGVDTWLYHGRRAPPFPRYQFAGGAGDFGFEAL